MGKKWLLVITLLVSSCSTLAIYNWNSNYGVNNPFAFDQPRSGGSISFQKDVKPILDNRCVVCHACYDAPCQLKLGSYQGIIRGASKNYIYGTRLLAAETSRLHHDAQLPSQWRQKDFFPVLNERRNSAEANVHASVLAQMLIQKQEHPLPVTRTLPDSFDFQLHRDQQCTNIENYASYKKDYPLWGMPYGLPGLNTTEHDTIMKWLEEGAPYDDTAQVTPSLQAQIKKWETFFNQDSLKAQLMSRYMYEHLFLAHLYFEDSSNPVFFELVRSTTPPGYPIDLIATRRPFDDPGVKRVYYRLRAVEDTIVLKTHLPYLLNSTRMEKWNKWFLAADYEVTKLPDYRTKNASNPFRTFEQIPSYARYRFMLEEAQFTIMGFIKGPVCRGQIALNVINDYFWVVFIDPETNKHELSDKFLSEHANDLQLPAEESSNAGILNWIAYAKQERDYNKKRVKELNQHIGKDILVDLNILWDGDGNNDNAALTIFRHFDSATVVKGLQGKTPQTAWVVSYPLLERIHYLLVAGFDVFGNVGHQLNTRIYMDFLRMEGEFNFLTLLPIDSRKPVRDQWYRGSLNSVKEHIYEYANNYHGSTSIKYKTDNPLQELYDKLQLHLSPVSNKDHHLSQGATKTHKPLSKLNSLVGIAASIMPQTSILEVVGNDGKLEYYSILSNSAYTNISHLLGAEERRLPKEDTLTVTRGIVGPYPNVLLRSSQSDLPLFIESVYGLRTEKDYQTMLDQFAIRRSSIEFWEYSDRLHQIQLEQDPIRFGRLDYNRLENR